MQTSFAAILLAACFTLFSSQTHSLAQSPGSATDKTAARPSSPADQGSVSFDAVADGALAAMQKQAGELGIEGVAVVAYARGESVRSWSSKMMVVGRMRVEPTATDKGSNLLAIAYAKAAEMADTLKDSGSQVRPPLTGEVGWTGGVIARVKDGYVIGAFSGGKSEDDLRVSHAGVDALKAKL